MKEKYKNPWTPEDEREHFPSIAEWWCPEIFFKTIEDNKNWNLKAVFSGWAGGNQVGSLFFMTLFDIDKDKNYYYRSQNYTTKLVSSKKKFNIKYNDCFLRGLYPNYDMFFKDPEHNIELDIKFHCESSPHWVAQDITDGYLPMGLGFYRYGFIPKIKATGTMKRDNKVFNIEGKGYYEHVWGSFAYSDPFMNKGQLKKTLSTYAHLVGWWIHNHKTKIPKSITFSTENSIFGYDWAWALLDNGWTIFYGNIMGWVMDGPAAGILVLSKDGKKYDEFADITFHYNKVKYSEHYDFYYPTELTLDARKGNQKLHLIFKMNTSIREHIRMLSRLKFWIAFVVCEGPGTVEGYYFDGNKKIDIKGVCKIEPQRQISKIGHNSLKLDFNLPPKGFGMAFTLDSHLIRKKLFSKIQIAPKPKIEFCMNRKDPSKIHKNIK